MTKCDMAERLKRISEKAGIPHGDIELRDGRISVEFNLTEEQWETFFAELHADMLDDKTIRKQKHDALFAKAFDQATDHLKKKAEEAWERIGVIAVNSGMCIVADPCELLHNTRHKHEDLGTDWQTFLDRFSEEWDRNPEHEEWRKKVGDGAIDSRGPMPALQKLSRPFRHQLNYNKGNPGMAVVSNTGCGDGIYGVFARKNEQGDVQEIKIDFKTIPEEYR